jgi:basic amino acid/polyamine antiporter, APA family
MTDHPQGQSLLRVLGFAFGLAVVIGGAVGQGIMRTPGLVAGAVPDPWLILTLWAVGGAAVLIDGLVVMELGAALPCTGGPYAFAQRAFGRLAGTMLGWTDWLQGVLSCAYITVVFGEYVQRLGVGTELPRGVISAALLLAIWAIHWSGTRAGGISQIIGTLLKALGLSAVIAVLFFVDAPSGTTPEQSAVPGGALGLAALAFAMRAIVVTYYGWNTTIYFCEELKEPARNVVRATFTGILAITALYLLMNAALLSVLTPAQMAASKLPAGDALAMTVGPWSDTLVTALAVLSVAAIANLTVMQFTRTSYGVARDGALPPILARVSSNGTPRFALAITVLTALVLTVSGSYETLLAMAAPPAMLINLIVDLTALRLRRTEPELHRPFRMPLYPLPALVGATINALLVAAMVMEDPVNSSIGFAVLLVIGAIYLVGPRLRRPAPAA